MIFYIDLQTGQVGPSPGLMTTNDVGLTRRDFKYISVVFTNGTSKTVYNISQLQVGIKKPANLAGDFLAAAFFTNGGTITNSGTTYNIYNASLNLNTPAIESAFTGEPQSISAVMEFQWVLSENRVNSSLPVSVKLYNDVIRGNEGIPATLPLFYTSETSDFLATQAEAEAGLDNTKWMSPLRVAQAIEELGGGGGGGGVSSWNDLTDKPSTFPPSTHTHALADTTGLETALDGKAATSHTHAATDITTGTLANARTTATNANTASAIVSRDASGNFSAGTITASLTGTASGNAPATGIAQSAVTNLTTDLAGKASSSHTHAATDITSGTLALARIPTGTTSSTVALGNHTHGNITNAGAIGTTSGVPIITGTSGVLQAGQFGMVAGRFAEGNHTHTFGTTAGTFCQGNDSRLLNLTGGITTVAVVAALPATPVETTLYIVTG